MITPDMGDMGKTLQLHIAFLALDAFHRAHGRYPRVRDETEAKEVLRLAQEQNSRLASVRQNTLCPKTACYKLPPPPPPPPPPSLPAGSEAGKPE